MLSKNNYKERIRKMEEQKERFSIRKFSVGAASVLIGFFLTGIGTQKADAATVNTNKDVTESNPTPDDSASSNESNKVLEVKPDSQATTLSVQSSAAESTSSAANEKTSSSATVLSTQSSSSNNLTTSASSAAVKSEAKLNVNSDAQPAVSTTDSNAKSLSDLDEALNSMADKGAVVGKNDKGIYAALDETQNQTIAVTNWNEFADAWNNSTVTQIDLKGDINVDDSSSVTKKPNPVVAKHKLEFTGNSISRKLTINGDNGKYSINFGDWYFDNSWENKVGLIHTNGNRSMGTPWDVTFNGVNINANNTNPFGFSGNTNNAPKGDAYDNTKYDKVTFNNVTANIKEGSLIDSANVNVQFSGDNNVTLQSIQNKIAGIDANSVQVLNGTTIINAASEDKTGGGVIDGEGMNVILVTPHNASDFTDPKTAYDSLHVAEGSTLTINANTKDQDGNLINNDIKNQYDLRGIVTRGMGVANASDWTDGTLTIDGNLNETLGSGHSSAIMARNLTINKTGNVNILTQQDNEHDGFEDSIVGAASVFNGFHAGVIALNVGGIQSSNIQAHDSSLIDNGTLKIVRKDVPADNKAKGSVWAPLIVMGTYGDNPVKYTMNVGEGATLDLQDQATFVRPALYTGKVMTNTPFAGLINMYGVKSNDVLSFTKPAYVNLQRTGQQTGTLVRLEGNNDSKNAGNMIQLNGVTPGGTPLSQWDTGNYTDNPSNTWRIQNLTAHDAKGMNAILGYETLKGSKDNHTLKFLDSNGAVTLTMDKTGKVVYTRNGDGQVVSAPQGTAAQEVQLNNFLNNFNFWTPQRISFGNKAAVSQSIYAPTDVEQGTTKTVKPTVFNKPTDSPEQDQIKTTYAKTDDTPAWVSVDENTGELTLTPTADNSKVGMYNIPVQVTYTDQTNSGEGSIQTVLAPVFVTDGNESVVWPKDPEGNLNGAIVITTDPSVLKAHETSDNNMDLKADAAVKSIDEYQMDTVNTISTTPTAIAKDSKGITIAWGTEPSTVVSEATKGETIKGTVNVTFDKDSQPFTDQVLDQDKDYTATSDLNIDAPGAVAQETAPATSVKAKAGTQLTDDQFKALVNSFVPANEINHATLQSVDKDNAVVRITFNDKDAKGQNTYLDVKVPASYLDTTTDADTYNPKYNPVNVSQGNSIETGEPTYGKDVTAPTGTTYTIPEGTKLPEGVTAKVDPNSGNVTVTTSDNTPEGPIFVPVTVNYPDGSNETIDAPIAVGANTFIGTDYSVSVDTNLDNLHETTANSMNPDAKNAITKITWWNNNDVRAGKNLDGTVIYNKANGTGDLNDVTVEWINSIDTNVDKATMDEILPGSNTSTVSDANPAIKITYGANSKLIKDTGNGIFSAVNGGSQTARWYGNGVTVQGADAKNPAKPVDVTAGVNELTSDQVAALINTTNLDKLTANKPVTYTWVTPLKKGDKTGTVKITFSDKAANGQATYLNVELPAGSINVTDPTDVINPTDPTDPTQKDLFTTVTRTIEVTNPETGETTSKSQSVTFARTKTIDKITKETVSYGEYKVWDGTKQTDKTTGSFAEFDVPQIEGYTSVVDGNAATKVAADNNVTPETKSSTVKVTYTADNQTRKIVFVDNGNTVGTQILTGKTGTSVTIGNKDNETPLQVPKGYEVVSGTEIPTTVPFNADSKDNGDITVQVQAKVNTDDGRNDKGNKDVYREVTRTITVNIEGQEPQTRTQTLAFYRIKTTNEATGEISYTDWTSNMEDGATSFPEVEIPSAAGYTRTITGGTITTKDGKDYVAAQSGLENGEPVNNITVTVNYTYSDQTATIKYVNNADHNDVVGTQVVGGKTGETVNVTYKAPENWKIVAGQSSGETITFGSTPIKDTIVYVEHGTKNVTDDPSQADKVNKTITRTIDLEIAGKTNEYKKQSITIHRTATEDLVTGEVTYGAWNVNGAKFDAVTAPEETGYTVTNPDAAPAMTITGKTESSTVTFIYTEKGKTPTYSENATGTPIVTDKGKMPNPADGIGNKDELDPNTKYTWTNGEPDVNKIGKTTVSITVTYPDGKTQTVDTPLIVTGTELPTNPNDPNQSDLFTKVTRTINGTTPDGKKVSDQPEEVIFGRTKTVDKNGDTTYGDYKVFENGAQTDKTTGSFAKVDVPQVDGYTSYVDGKAAKEVPAINDVTPETKSATVNVTYTEKGKTPTYSENATGTPIVTDKGKMPNPADGIGNKDELDPNTKYTWTNGEPDVNKIGKTTVSITVTYPDGKTQTVDTPLIVTGTELPTNPNDPNQSDLFTKVTRTINGTTPDGKKVSDQPEEVIFGRTKTVDKNGDTTYGDYKVFENGAQTDKTTGSFAKVDVPQVDGYTSYVDGKAEKEVPAVNGVTPETKSATVNVTYTEKGKTPTYSENATGTPIVTDKGKMPNPADGIGNKDELDPNTKYTWTNGEPDVNKIGKTTVSITVTYPDGKTQTVDTPLIVTGTELPTNPNDPNQSDLFKTITRTISVTTPNGKTDVQKQTAIFARTKTVDKNGNTSYSAYTVYNTEANKLTNDKETIFSEVPVVQFDKYVSQVNGQPATKVLMETVTSETQSSTVTVNYVKKGSDADKYVPEGQDVKTKQGIVPEASEGIKNKTDMPEGTKYTWKDTPDVTTPGSHDATVVVTYPDGSKDEVPTTVTVPTPEGQNINTPYGVVPNPAEGIKNKTDMPEGTKYTWKDTPDVTTPGNHDATVVVTYPDNKTSEIPVTITVGKSDADKYTPEGQNIPTIIGTIPDPEEGIKNKTDMPEGTKYTWKDTPDVTTPGSHDATIVVTYPDGSKDEVPVKVDVTDNTPSTPVVTPTDADRYTPEGQDVTTVVGTVPEASEGIKNRDDMPEGTKYTWKDTPDVTTPGNHDATIVVTYPDGSQDEVSTKIIVISPEGQDVTTVVGTVPEASEGIKNRDDMPEGTKYTWKDTPDVTTPGSHDATIVVTLPNGKTVEVPIKVIVGNDDDINPIPEGQPIHTNQGTLPDPAEGIKNRDDMPEGTKYTWKKKPNVKTPGKHKGTIRVTFPNGETVDVPVTVVVAPKSDRNDIAGVHGGDNESGNNVRGNGNENITGVKGTYESNMTGNKESNRNSNRDKTALDSYTRTLPQTGTNDGAAAMLGILIASVGAIMGLAVEKKRRN